MWYFAGLLGLAVVILAAGCSGSPLSPSPHSSSGFSLAVTSDPVVTALMQGEFAMSVAQQGGETEVRVSVSRARGLKAALFTVEYDPARYTPLSVEDDSVLREGAGSDELLCLSVLDRPGRVYCGQVLAYYDKLAGFTGSGEIAVLRFALRPFASVARTVSAPPDSASSSIPDLTFNSGTGELSWHFYNQGDYDQNGEVGLSDLAPIARFYQQSVAPADVNTAKGVADGDGNGLVTLGDIQPIAANFLKSVNGGWKVYGSANTADYPTDPHGGNGGATFLVGKLLDQFDPSTNATTDRLLYKGTVITPLPGESYWVRGVDAADAEGIASNMVAGGSGNPVAAIGTTAGNGSMTGTAPYDVFFDGSASYDPGGGTITSWLWDMNDDGTTDWAGPTGDWIFRVLGTQTVRLTVSNGTASGSRTVTIQVNAPGSWHVSTVSTADDCGAVLSIADIGGHPAIVYAHRTGGGDYLEYTTSSSIGETGTWSTPVQLANITVDSLSLSEVTGQPAVAACWNVGGQQSLVYYRYNGSAWVNTFVNGGYNCGMYCDLAVAGGMPRISYNYNNISVWDKEMLVSSGFDADGAAWVALPVSIEGAPPAVEDTGLYSSIVPLSDGIGVAYYDQTQGCLRWAVSPDFTPSAFAVHTVAGNTSELIGRLERALMLPAPTRTVGIFCLRFNGSYDEVQFYNSADDHGNSWQAPYLVNMTVGTAMDAAVVDGQPAVAAYDTNNWVVYMRSEAMGTFVNPPVSVVDTFASSDTHQAISMVDIGGHPVIAYYDYINKDLKAAVLYP